jgi:DNA-binding HxlR family transcriptional regulator
MVGDVLFDGDHRADSVASALEQVGDRWTFLVLRECFFGVRRFTEIQRNIGVARNILANRLSRLVELGILERHRYCERPPRDEYRLTDKGRDLYGVTVALMFWADHWIVENPPLALRHKADGAAIEQVLRCTHCGQDLAATDIDYHETRRDRARGKPTSSTTLPTT